MFKIQNNGSGEIFYATLYSAGFDIPSNEDTIIDRHEWKAVSTGLSLVNGKEEFDFFEEINKNMKYPVISELQIRPRSGLAFKYGITVLNSPGTIDFDYLYPNEIKVILVNHGRSSFEVKKGDRIAQNKKRNT